MRSYQNNTNFVSIIIPCRNEEKFIGKCLDSILEQDYPQNKMEILVIDGISQDKTPTITQQYCQKYPFIRLVKNDKKTTPHAFNLGLKNARGELIMFLGSHSQCGSDYIAKCVTYITKYSADVVGGITIIAPTKNTTIARAIVICLSYFFGTGNAHFKQKIKKPKWVDTVFNGCYTKTIIKKTGLFNTNLVRSQDMEFNRRLQKAGGKILLVPDIVSYYYPKDNLGDFFVHNFYDGIWAIYPLKFVKTPLCLRHYLSLCFVLGFLAMGLLGIFWPICFWLFLLMLTLYFLIGLFFGLQTALKQKRASYIILLPLAFATRHFGYGLGSLWGLCLLLKPRKQ